MLSRNRLLDVIRGQTAMCIANHVSAGNLRSAIEILSWYDSYGDCSVEELEEIALERGLIE